MTMDDACVTALTRAVREADQEFLTVGGSTRHFVRDCLLPALHSNGLAVAVAASSYDDEVRRTMGSGAIPMLAMGLAGECGEVVDLLKKVEYHGRPLDRDALVKEAGDLYWYFTALRLVLGISLDEVMAANVAKLRARYPDGFSIEAAQARKDEVK